MNLIQKKIEILRNSRELISSGQVPYVCYAISEAVGKLGHRYRRAGSVIEDYIMDVIGPHAFLSGWQRYNGIYHDRMELKQDRIQWIDWMIACLEEDLKGEK